MADNNHDSERYTLAYLSCPPGPDKNYLGGLLLTDSRSRPLHFGYVAPVRPTQIQRMLYGGTLQEHVRVDVIARKLFTDGIPVVPSVLFVDDSGLLPARHLVKVPTAVLAKRSSSEGQTTSLSSVQYETNIGSGDDDAVGSILASLEQTFDLTEPFDRIRDALKEAMKDHKG